MDIPKELVLVAASTAYALLRSQGIGRKLDDERVSRPLVVAGGVLLTIAVWSWGDATQMGSWFTAFAIASLPQLLEVAVTHVREREQQNVARHSVKDVNDDME